MRIKSLIETLQEIEKEKGNVLISNYTYVASNVVEIYFHGKKTGGFDDTTVNMYLLTNTGRRKTSKKWSKK